MLQQSTKTLGCDYLTASKLVRSDKIVANELTVTKLNTKNNNELYLALYDFVKQIQTLGKAVYWNTSDGKKLKEGTNAKKNT